MTALGMIANVKNDRNHLHLLRLMAAIQVMACLVTGVLFIFGTTGEELIIDRTLCLFIALLTLGATFLQVDRRSILGLFQFSLYVYTAQTLLACYINGFNELYTINMVITIQAIGVALGNGQRVLKYCIFTCSVIILEVAFLKDLDLSQKITYSLTCITPAAIVYAIVSVKDTVEKRLKFKEEFLRTLVTKTEEAILISDFEGDIFEINEVALYMFGYSQHELEGNNFSMLRQNALTKEEDAKGVKILLENKFWNDEILLRKKDKSTFDAYVSVSYIKKQKEEYLVYRVSDISMRKTAEKQLIQAKEEAEAAAVAKTSFLATMSHEIRTPMNGVLGMANILKNTELNNEQSGYVDTVLKSGQNLLSIINEVLDFSKAESGKMTLENIPMNIEEQITDAMDLMSAVAEEKGLTITGKVEADTPEIVLTDPTKIKQVLTNLVSNSLKFTSKGGVHINVKQRIEEDDYVYLEFSVKDTGIGIKPENLSKVFDSFTQSDSTTTRKYGGTGLGLAICKKLVDLMGGNIWVDSKFGEGSSFYFTIKAGKYVHEDKNTAELHEEDETNLMSGIRILLAEDNKVNQEVATLIFKGMGGKVEVAENGAEAIEMCRKSSYELIFMDVQMPEVDGIEATKEILSNESAYGSPYIIAMTANAFEEDKENCFNAGMHDFISKPIMMDDLKSTVRKFKAIHKKKFLL